MDKIDQAAVLMRTIDEAFADVIQPDPHSLVRQSRSPPPEPMFEDLEEPYIRRDFGGKCQSEITEIGTGMVEELLSMTGPAVRYYLPCFLKHVLGKPDFGVLASLIGFLDIQKSASQGFMWPRFTNDQKTAVLLVVEYLLRHLKSYDLRPFDEDYRKQLQHVRLQWRRI